ncbi:hypothetical protein CRG98_038926 [Punica granatum]|uniref:Importin subunit alpha-1-like n=1 Tax=Punica granatum TaxID=22663 RepID=A0A2I0I9M2_PUNGR|nr:hypothetical protein CRG98_038926 [Punica granatum]
MVDSNAFGACLVVISGIIEADLIKPLINLLQQADHRIKQEAAFAIGSAICKADDDQLRYFGNQGCVRPFSNLLASDNREVLHYSLRVVEKILKVGHADKKSGKTGDENVYLEMLRNAGGICKLLHLTDHARDEDIQERAKKVIQTYYWMEQEMVFSKDDEGGTNASYGSNSSWRS